MSLVDLNKRMANWNISESEPPTQTATTPIEVAREKVQFGHYIISKNSSAVEKTKVAGILKETVKDWYTIASDRLCRSKTLADSIPYAKNSAEKELMLSNKNHHEDDIKLASDYAFICPIIISEIDEMIQNDQLKVIVIADSQKRIQALISTILKANTVQVHVLMTAAWNLRMHGENTREHTPFVVKGAGTSALAAAYTLAQQRKKPMMTLKSMWSSLSFYEKKIGMQKKNTDEGTEFSLVVDPVTIPASLVHVHPEYMFTQV